MLQVLAELIHGKEICRRASNPSLEWVGAKRQRFFDRFSFLGHRRHSPGAEQLTEFGSHSC